MKRKDSMEPNVCKKHPLRLCTRKEKHHRVHRLDSSSCVRKAGFFTSQIPSGYQTLASFLSLSVNIHPNKPEVPPYPFCVSAPNPIKHVRLASISFLFVLHFWLKRVKLLLEIFEEIYKKIIKALL